MNTHLISTTLHTMTHRPRSEWTHPCPHCGRELITTHGIFAMAGLDEEKDRAELDRLEALELHCPCPAATQQRAAEQAAEQAAADAKRERALTAKQESLFARSGMPEEWRHLSLKHWEKDTAPQRLAFEAAADFGAALIGQAQSAPKSLFIAGDVGTGKTFLAACLVRDLHRRLKPALWARVGDILRAIKHSFSASSRLPASEDPLEKYQRAPLLVLDDLGKERPTEWALEQLFSLINHRYEHRLPLIVTTNYGAASLVRRLTPSSPYTDPPDDTTARAIVDRLCEMCTSVQLTGKSHRQSPAA